MGPDKIHGHPVLGWIQTGTHSNGDQVGIVLVQTRGQLFAPEGVGTPEYVTASYVLGQHEWGHGHYFRDAGEALADFAERARYEAYPLKRKQRTVIRVIVLGNNHGDWFGHENDRHNVGELLQVLDHAGALYSHKPDGEKQEKHIFDIFPPAGVDEKRWAKMESERLQSFGYNAVPAPEWKEN